MTFTLCPVNAGAIDRLPAKSDDKSGVGVHYVDFTQTSDQEVVALLRYRPGPHAD